MEPSSGFRPDTCQGHPPTAEISLWHFSCCPWEPSQPSHVSFRLLTSHIVVKCFFLSVLGYKASVWLVLHWLFWMISLQFSCNFILILGGGQCVFHLFLSHLGFCPPLAGAQGSGCKQNFVCWPLKSLSASPAISPWETETLLLFTAGCYLGFFLALVL